MPGDLVEAQRASGKHYMMMETVVYSREFLFVKQLYESGELGRLQFLRGSHLQEMAGWPGYWEGPAADALRHALREPLPVPAGQAGRERGVPRLGPDQRGADRRSTARRSPSRRPRSTCATRTCAAEVTRSLFETARQYIESFDVYGDKVSFEWPRIEHEPAVLHRGEKPERVKVPDFADRLPEGIRRFTTKGVYDADETQHLSFLQGSGHGGSHPHLAHEFISAIVEDRAAASQRRDQRQLDDDRHLCPHLGDEGGRAGARFRSSSTAEIERVHGEGDKPLDEWGLSP